MLFARQFKHFGNYQFRDKWKIKYIKQFQQFFHQSFSLCYFMSGICFKPSVKVFPVTPEILSLFAWSSNALVFPRQPFLRPCGTTDYQKKKKELSQNYHSRHPRRNFHRKLYTRLRLNDTRAFVPNSLTWLRLYEAIKSLKLYTDKQFVVKLFPEL